jgi:hypothetical protein
MMENLMSYRCLSLNLNESAAILVSSKCADRKEFLCQVRKILQTSNYVPSEINFRVGYQILLENVIAFGPFLTDTISLNQKFTFGFHWFKRNIETYLVMMQKKNLTKLMHSAYIVCII